MILTAEGIAILTLLFKIFLTTVIGTTLLCIFLNYNTKLIDKDKKAKQERIANEILKDYSINNAMIINRETINRNNYVRSPEKSFFEDMIKTEQKQTDTVECKIISNIIKCYPRNFQEDSSIEREKTSEDTIQTYSQQKNKALKKQLLKK